MEIESNFTELITVARTRWYNIGHIFDKELIADKQLVLTAIFVVMGMVLALIRVPYLRKTKVAGVGWLALVGGVSSFCLGLGINFGLGLFSFGEFVLYFTVGAMSYVISLLLLRPNQI